MNYYEIVMLLIESFEWDPYIPYGYSRFDLFMDCDTLCDDDYVCVWALYDFYILMSQNIST
jgi:hypothetical protein